MKNGRPSNILPLLFAIRHPVARDRKQFEVTINLFNIICLLFIYNDWIIYILYNNTTKIKYCDAKKTK